MSQFPGGKPEWSVEVQDLSKFYSIHAALSHITFHVAQGDFLAVTGHNGAGKTTLLRILSTLSKPTSGTARINGFDVAAHPEGARKSLGLLGHGLGVYEDLTGEENLFFFARLYEIAESKRSVQRALDACGLGPWKETKVRYFSHGMKKRLALARLILVQPDVVLLDEPHAALDSQGVLILKEFLSSFKRAGGSAIIATHNLPLVSTLCDQVIRLRKGKIDRAGNGAAAG